MAAKWNMIVDVARCDNCRGCFLAVKDEHTGNDFPGYAAAQPAQGHNWLEIRRKERGRRPLVEAHFMPVMCNHCDDAPCMKAARNGAISKRPDGIVIIDPEKSKGQKQIVDACPYGAISWNEEQQIPQAWIFDAHLLDQGWTKTRAEQICPTGVFRSVKVEDSEMQRLAAAEELAVLQPELNTRPRVYYKNLHLMTRCFVGGSVAADLPARPVGAASAATSAVGAASAATQAVGAASAATQAGFAAEAAPTGTVEECVSGAQVILKHQGREIGRATTDTFGEWKIDNLEPNSGGYQVEITGSAGRYSMAFDLGAESRYLGVMKLS